jgi:hypothetical protein
MNWDFLDIGPLGWGILAVVFILTQWYARRKRARSPVPVVRVQAPGSNVFRNLIVLAVVVGLGWFFWYVMGTRCHGSC